MEMLFTWVAKLYGYYTITNLLKENLILVLVIGAFIAVCLAVYRVMDRQFPKPGQDPLKSFCMKFTIIFLASAFSFVMLFSVFYEVRKVQKEQSHYLSTDSEQSVIV